MTYGCSLITDLTTSDRFVGRLPHSDNPLSQDNNLFPLHHACRYHGKAFLLRIQATVPTQTRPWMLSKPLTRYPKWTNHQK